MQYEFDDAASLMDEAAQLLAEFDDGSIEDRSRPRVAELVDELTATAANARVVQNARVPDARSNLIAAAEIALAYFEDTRHGREWIESGGVEAAELREALALCAASESKGGA